MPDEPKKTGAPKDAPKRSKLIIVMVILALIISIFFIFRYITNGQQETEQQSSFLEKFIKLRLLQQQDSSNTEDKQSGFSIKTTNSVSVEEETIRLLNESDVPYTINSSVNPYKADGFVKDVVNHYDISPYAGTVVFLDRLDAIRQSTPESEFLVLRFDDALTRNINITGWKLVGRDSRVAYTIPKAIHVLGKDNEKELLQPIFVGPSTSVIISSGRSPIGFSFLVNKCSGYRSQFKTFIPSIKTKCMDPLQEFIDDGSVPYTDTECYNFVERIPKCSVVTDLPPGITRECKKFLETKLSETACVKNHINDQDFFSAQWRVFLNSRNELWGDVEETIYLLDEENRLITAYVY